LIQKEVELARVEMTARLSRAGRHAALISAGSALLYAGVLALVAALVLLLAQVTELSPWVSALIVGVLVAIVGGVIVNSALAALKRESLKPTETIRTLKEGAAWAKTQTK
jgi:precorrin-3B methylase